MANHYLLFSAGLELKTEEEREWARARLTLLGSDIYELEQDHPEVFSQLVSDGWDVTSESSFLGFDWDIEEDNTLWMHSDEVGSIYHLALFVKEYLKKFNPTQVFSTGWAYTCSSPRIDSFGGGAVVVTADVIEIIDSFEWVQQKIEELIKKKTTQEG